ncbi:helix-turn-helix domain-containing protein [Vagococcus entomophilus]|uniref:Mga helix-turn-helix domain-containing protein n=1 Tax=Vagococcus entomophilus TaxID=1160095 RepID=A0A430AKM2_9ENTE|nr:helix-turn-helix domain-containing protein [Vagococcus entomophilus]RSU08609.1 hypothetical protein CBF30_05115 [Vagococcus entomophilus]
MVNVRELLSKALKRQLELLEYFHAQKECTFTQIRDTFKEFSAQTIRTDILFCKKFIPSLVIEQEKAQIKRVCFPEAITENELYVLMYKESLELQILEELFFVEEHSYQSLADKFFVSETTIFRAVHRIRTELKHLEIQIETQPIKVRGNEDYVRQFYLLFFQEKYLYQEIPIGTTKFFDDCTLILKKMLDEHSVHFYKMEEFKLWLAISCYREGKDNHIAYLHNRTFERKLIKIIETNFAEDELSVHLIEKVKSIFYYLFNVGVFLDFSDFKESLEREFSQKMMDTNKATKKLVHKISPQLSEKETMILSYQIYQMITVNKQMVIHELMRKKEREITLSDPINSTLLELVRTEIGGCCESLDNQLLYLIYSQIILSQSRIYEHFLYAIPKMKTGLFYWGGLEFYEYIKINLLFHFPSKLEVIFYFDQETIQKDFQKGEIDCIVSQRKISQQRNVVIQEKIFRIEDYFEVHQMIDVFYSKYLKENYLNDPSSEK